MSLEQHSYIYAGCVRLISLVFGLNSILVYMLGISCLFSQYWVVVFRIFYSIRCIVENDLPLDLLLSVDSRILLAGWKYSDKNFYPAKWIIRSSSRNARSIFIALTLVPRFHFTLKYDNFTFRKIHTKNSKRFRNISA
jgi:hypothetical protein